jgi:hypothetical protein
MKDISLNAKVEVEAEVKVSEIYLSVTSNIWSLTSTN